LTPPFTTFGNELHSLALRGSTGWQEHKNYHNQTFCPTAYST